MSEKVLILVGMGSGVSQAVAELFGRNGYALGLVARTEEALARHAKDLRAGGFRAEYSPGNASDRRGLDKAIAALQRKLGPADVLVYNAYAASPGLPSTLPPEDLESDLSVNVTGALVAVRAVLPRMKERGTGTILFTGGGLAIHPSADAASLSIGKAGLRALALVLNEEMRPSGVHVATVTIAGYVGSGPAFQPAAIADAFWRLVVDDMGAMEAETIVQ